MYSIQYKEDVRVIKLKDISTSEFEALEYAHQILERFTFYRRKLKEIELNHDEYIKKFNSYTKIPNKEGLSFESLDDIFVDLNRLFINFITSFKFFIDYLDKRFKKRLGQESDKYQIFEKFKTSNYLTYFSYRLFINLRNYCQHRDFPIMNFSEDRYYSSNEKIINRKLNVDFNKNKLLEDETIKRKLKDDLRNYGIKFPVFPLMMEILKPLSNIKSIIFKIENEDLLVADEIISKYKNLVSNCVNYLYYL